jgi:ABC-type lipoprotein release transport system permease subunit
MHQWLQQYAYRASIEFWQFVLSGVAIMLLTLLVVSLNALRAARMKPSTSLRTE